MELLLRDEHIKRLDALLGDIPAKFSLPVIQYLSLLVQEQNKPVVEPEKKAEKLKAPKLRVAEEA